jgi:hypothetical protein
MLTAYSAAGLGGLLHPTGSRWKLLAVPIAYFDDSGAHGGPADVFTIGGWVAKAPPWTRLERAWDRALGWRVLHMVDFSHRRGDFKSNWSEKKRIQLVANLADSIRNTIIFGVAHSVILADFKQVFAPDIGYQQLKKKYLCPDVEVMPR